MPSIPTYQRQFLPQGDLVGARANTNNAPDDAIGRAMQGIGQQGMGLANTMMRVDAQQEAEAKRVAEEDGAHKARTLLPQGDVHFQEVTTKAMQGWKVGDPDLRETVGKDFDAWVTDNTEKLPTPASKKYFIEHAASMKARLQTGVFAHMEKAKEANAKVDNELSLQADEVSVSKDPDRFDELFKRQVEPLVATSTDQAATKAQAALIKNRLSLAASVGKMRKDPGKYFRDNFGEMPGAGGGWGGTTGGGFDSVMQGIFKHEGGYNAKDGGNGAPVNFGINQGHNPDIDVKNLTKGEAAKLYKTRYWDKIGGDNLPPELQGTAMDAAVNQGPANAQKWITESGGDPAKFNALRRAHYEKLLEKPENAQYRGTWMRRLASYETGRTGTAAAPGAPPGDGVPTAAPAMASDPILNNLRLDQIEALRQQTESLAKQQATAAAATVSVAAARAVVDAQPSEPDTLIDIPKAKAEAVAKAEAAMGAPMTEQQRAVVETAVEQAASDKERDRKRAESNDLQTAFDLLDKNGGDIVAFQRDNQPLLARLGREGKERVEKQAGRVATGETRTTDWTAYQALVEDPAALKAVNLASVRDKFGASELAQLAKMQDGLNKDVGHEDNIRTNLVIVKEMLKTAKITDDKKEAKFYSMLQSAIDQELAATGKKALTQAQTTKLADDLLVKTITSKGMIWDTEEPSFNITVPPVERDKIEAALMSNGLPVNDYEIMRQYRKKLQAKSVLAKPVKPATEAPH